MSNKMVSIIATIVFTITVTLFALGIVNENDQLKVVTAVPMLVSFVAAFTGYYRWSKYGATMTFKNDNNP